jgi:hypothetical protein
MVRLRGDRESLRESLRENAARTGANMPNPKRSCQNTTYRWCGKRSLK